MYNMDVEYNLFSGELPSELIGNLPELDALHLSYNYMESHDNNTNLDPFFSALGNCTSLRELELAGMHLGGRLPSSIGQLSIDLESLLLQENQIFGAIPPNLANLSNLLVLNLTSNLLNGTIAAAISQLPSLQQLFLSHNLFNSAIPSSLGKFPHLGLLDLSHNKFSGEIPASLGNLVQINYLFLNNNLLSGMIPPTLGQCTDLNELDLSYNRLSGSIPPELAGMREIRIFINLSHNEFEGPLPIELSKLENVQEMDLSSNKLTGSIFLQLSSCIALRMINFSNNSLEGHLPESLGELKNLESFDVSGNHLSGMIPISLNKIHSLTYLNLSLNNFEGMIPIGGIFDSLSNMSFLKNHRLCKSINSSVAGIPICSHKRRWIHSRVFLIMFIVVIFISVFLSAICCVIGFRHVIVIIQSQKTQTVRKPTTPEPLHNIPRITYKELSDATAGFDEERLVGSGGYGHVYRGVLPDGTAIAVKVLHVQSGNSTKTFNRECQVLKRIRHRNLIRIITACSLPDFKALVLPYMGNGSLESRLYPHSVTGLRSGSSDLSLVQRVNICCDIAEGMAYLHHHSPVKVIHCDLKPSNVLLNDDMTALVSDFGIARLVMTAGGGNGAAAEMGNSTANMLCGSIGYIAPEYGFGSTTSTKGDVYSFGILVLEMVTRKRPTDDMFVGGLSLHNWVKKSHYHGRVERVIDPSLESSSTRPTMLDAADDLDRLKRYLSGDSTTATFASSLGISSSTLGDD
uniref:non-specific serine/threonine protein kinase n=1 Tax=Fagus sylvatica TaxID=28930 RepID=A0A2N9FTD4_FAGSY